MNKTKPILRGAVLALCLATPAAQAGDQELDCSPFRYKDELKTNTIYSAKKILRDTEWVQRATYEIYYLPEYNRVPGISTCAGDCRSIHFTFNIESNRPTFSKDPKFGTLADSFNNVDIHITGDDFNTLPMIMIGSLGYHVNRADRHRVGSDFALTGDDLAGFQIIRYDHRPDDPGTRRSAEYGMSLRELGVRLDAHREVKSFLRCTRIGARPNPICFYNTRHGSFRIRANFNRKQLPNIDTIIDKVDTFTACLFEAP